MEQWFLVDLLTFCLLLVYLFWLLTDPRSVKARVTTCFQTKSILIGVFSMLFYATNYLSGRFFPLPSGTFDQLGQTLGLLLFFLGIGLSIWAKLTMKNIWGVPAEHHIKRQNKLVTNGPFQYTRNPIYIGLVMVLTGYGFAINSYFTFLVSIPIWYFYRSALKEEKLLEKHFGQKYLEYKKTVPLFV